MTTAQNRAKELVPIIQAFADGKRVEYRVIDMSLSVWTPVFSFFVFGDNRMEFRIAPNAPRKPREVWVNDSGCGFGVLMFSSERDAWVSAGNSKTKQVLLREVIEPDKKAREFWIVGGCMFNHEALALAYKANHLNPLPVIHVREVLE